MTYKTDLSTKQTELMRVLAAGNGVSEPADLDEILERVSYQPTKQAIHFSLRALIKHELIEKLGVEKRRGRQRQVIQATAAGHALVRYAAKSAATVVGLTEDLGDVGLMASFDPLFSVADVVLETLV